MYLPNSIKSLWEKLDKLCTFKFSLIGAKQLGLQELRILWAAVCWMSTGNVSEETLSSPGLRNFQPEVETHNPVAEVRPKVKLFLLWSPSRFRSGCSCRDRGPRWGHVLRDALKKHTHTKLEWAQICRSLCDPIIMGTLESFLAPSLGPLCLWRTYQEITGLQDTLARFTGHKNL